MTTEFKAMLFVSDHKKNPVQGEWRCEITRRRDYPIGSRENPVFGCRVLTDRRIYPGSWDTVRVQLVDPWEGSLPEHFWICEGRAVGFLRTLLSLD